MSQWSIQEITQLVGVSSRTLRHYDAIGLLKPSGLTTGGNRAYDEQGLLRLQQILVLRQLGLSLAEIGKIVDGQHDNLLVLRDHVVQLEREHQRLAKQIRSVKQTITALEKGEELMPKNMFDGFDHTEYREEVVERWGEKAYADSNNWWKTLGKEGQVTFQEEMVAIQDAFDAALLAGESPESDTSQQVAKRQYEWIAAAWGNKKPSREALEGLATMYVEDPRFAKNYTRASDKGAEFVRDALFAFAKNLD